MPYYDLSGEDEEITLEKVLENYKFLDYITTKKFRENPTVELLRDRRTFRKSERVLKRVIKKRNKKNEKV